MRNTKEYPIFPRECIDHVRRHREEEMAKGLIGGTGPYCLSLVAEFLSTDGAAAFATFLDSRK